MSSPFPIYYSVMLLSYTCGVYYLYALKSGVDRTIRNIKRKLHQLALAQLLYNEKSAIVFANFIEVITPRQSHG